MVDKARPRSAWEQLLVQDRLSAELRNELRAHTDQAGLKNLSIIVRSKQDLHELKAACRDVMKTCPKDLKEELKHELSEITSDIGFAASKHGEYVIAVNKWVEPFYNEFRSCPDYRDVIIGGHTSANVIYVGGRVASSEALEKLLEYVHSKKPPFKLMLDLKVVGQ